MTAIRNPVRERLDAGGLAIGLGLRQARTIDIAKLAKVAGYDWLFIDLEHGAMSLDTATQIAVAALDAGVAPLVRVPAGQYSMATRALDNGALGIVIPHVDTPDEAREAVDRLKFPPLGHRSIGGPLAQVDYQPLKPAELTATVNAATMVVAMVESPRAVENAAAIAAVPGIDALLIGTNDLAAEMGLTGQLDHARVAAAYESVIAACRKHGKIPAMGGVYGEALLRRYIGLGMRMALAGNDFNLLLQAAGERATFLRGL